MRFSGGTSVIEHACAVRVCAGVYELAGVPACVVVSYE